MSQSATSHAGRHAHRVIAVVTTFHPDHQAFINNCRLLAQQVKNIVVVDDGTGAEFDALATKLSTMGIRVVRHQDNRGIAAAINSGYKVALATDAEFVVTFDQDSTVPSKFIDGLVDAYDHWTVQGLTIGMVCPEYFASVRQTAPRNRNNIPSCIKPIQSGLLMPRNAISRIGPQREDLFIDLVDTEYFLRCKQLNFSAIYAAGLKLEHNLGRTFEVSLFGKPIRLPGNETPLSLSLSSPFRYYYRSRNRVVINRLFGSEQRFRTQLISDTVHDYLHFYVFAMFFSSSRKGLWRILRAGHKAGKNGTMGRIPSDLLNEAKNLEWRV